MKRLGIVLIAIGIALLLFVLYNFVSEKNKMASPIPEDKGVKVIFVTPSKQVYCPILNSKRFGLPVPF